MCVWVQLFVACQICCGHNMARRRFAHWDNGQIIHWTHRCKAHRLTETGIYKRTNFASIAWRLQQHHRIPRSNTHACFCDVRTVATCRQGMEIMQMTDTYTARFQVWQHFLSHFWMLRVACSVWCIVPNITTTTEHYSFVVIALYHYANNVFEEHKNRCCSRTTVRWGFCYFCKTASHCLYCC